jgi:hypothetical protein
MNTRLTLCVWYTQIVMAGIALIACWEVLKWLVLALIRKTE